VENFVEYRCFVLFDVDLDFGSSLVEEYYRRVQHYRHPFFEIHNTVDSAEREFGMESRAEGSRLSGFRSRPHKCRGHP